MAETEIFEIKQCARCGLDHTLTFKRFANPIVATEKIQFDTWAICPTNGEPIVMGRFFDSDTDLIPNPRCEAQPIQ